MNTDTGKALYKTALFREPESDAAAAQWNGKAAKDALDNVRSKPEWLTVNHRLKVELPALKTEVADLKRQRDELAVGSTSKDEAIAKLNEALLASELKLKELENLKGQDAPPENPVPAPLPEVIEPVEEAAAVVEVAQAEVVEAAEEFVPTPEQPFQFHPYPAEYTAVNEEPLEVIDYGNQGQPLTLVKGAKVIAAGTFTRHNRVYIRTQKSADAGRWYGIPQHAVKLDRILGDWLNDDSLFNLDDLKAEVAASTSPSQLAALMGQLHGLILLLASRLNLLKKPKP